MTDPYNPKPGEYLSRGSWRGFLIESKSYMGYGVNTPRWKFWLYYPIAWWKFHRPVRNLLAKARVVK